MLVQHRYLKKHECRCCTLYSIYMLYILYIYSFLIPFLISLFLTPPSPLPTILLFEQRQRIQVWLYEQTVTRIDGQIVVSNIILLKLYVRMTSTDIYIQIQSSSKEPLLRNPLYRAIIWPYACTAFLYCAFPLWHVLSFLFSTKRALMSL